MNLSKRHHYIPQFLIKNFTDNDGFLYVYNKQEKTIQKKAPKQVFFEWNRNITKFNGVPDDHLERLYSDLDSALSIPIANILKTGTYTPEELSGVAVLVSLLKWRIPASDQTFSHLREDATQEDLAITITVKDKSLDVDPLVIAQIENSDIFKETKRVLLGLLPFVHDQSILMDLYLNSFVLSTKNYNSILGDYPLIEKKHHDIRKIEDFVFPLGSNTIFVHKKGTSRAITNDVFFFNVDLATYHLSDKFVACNNRNHLESIIKMYEEIKREEMIDSILKHFFDFVKS